MRVKYQGYTTMAYFQQNMYSGLSRIREQEIEGVYICIRNYTGQSGQSTYRQSDD